jgi:predicted amidophosphoribosyltransferase
MSTFKEKTTKYSSFVNNKNKKKQANIQDTVDICHKKMMDSFQKGHSSVDKWNQKIDKYKNEIQNINTSDPSLENTNKKNFFEDKIKMLEKNINEIKKNDAELDYFYNTMDILVNYYDSESNISNKATLLNDYLKITTQTSNKLSHKTILECPECQTEMTVHQHDGLIVCTVCGRSNDILLDTDKPNYKEPVQASKNYTAYKRKNHLNERINQFQAKETIDIPPEIYEEIKQEIKKLRLDNDSITHKVMRDILKKLGHNKYYEHITHIICYLTCKLPITISREAEHKIDMMFEEIQEPFELYKPKNRKSCLNYNYLMHKFFELLELDDYLIYFPLLKNRDKLQEVDATWKQICNDLNWEYIPSI